MALAVGGRARRAAHALVACLVVAVCSSAPVEATTPEVEILACATYTAIYGRSPVGLPFDFTGMGNPDEAYDAALRAQRLLPHQARAIQLAAWAAWQRWQQR